MTTALRLFRVLASSLEARRAGVRLVAPLAAGLRALHRGTSPLIIPLCQAPAQFWRAHAQVRGVFIQTESTPNPSSLMFYPGKPVMESGSTDFPNARSAMVSPLAKAIFSVEGVQRVFFGSDFVTVSKSEEHSWEILKPEIFAVIMDFYTSGQPVFTETQIPAAADTAIHEDDSQAVAMIKELLETRIRPAVRDDGGDIEYLGFDTASGIVTLKMQGACSGCPSSAVTLKSGIENTLMHYVPEVKGVREATDQDGHADADAAKGRST